MKMKLSNITTDKRMDVFSKNDLLIGRLEDINDYVRFPYMNCEVVSFIEKDTSIEVKIDKEVFYGKNNNRQ